MLEKILGLIDKQEKVIQEIEETRKKLIDAELKEKEHECNLWLNTNFSSKGCSNKELREAYVRDQMKDYISSTSYLKSDLKTLELTYDLLSRKIRVLSTLLDKKELEEVSGNE